MSDKHVKVELTPSEAELTRQALLRLQKEMGDKPEAIGLDGRAARAVRGALAKINVSRATK